LIILICEEQTCLAVTKKHNITTDNEKNDISQKMLSKLEPIL
jgi:hypothetical protein